MKKAMVILALAVGLPLALLAVVVVASDPFLESRIEASGSAAAGADLRLEEVDLDLLAGRFDLRDLALSNPRGFDEPHAVQVAEVQVGAGLFELIGEPTRIERVVVDRPVFTLEVALRGTNLGRIVEHLREYQDRPPVQAEEEPREERELRVGLIRIVTPRVVLAQSILGADRRELTLDTIVLRETTPGEVGRQTLSQVLERIVSAVLAELAAQGALPDQLEERIRAEAGELTGRVEERAREELEEAEGRAREAVEEAEGRAREAVEEGGRRAREAVEEGARDVLGGQEE